MTESTKGNEGFSVSEICGQYFLYVGNDAK